MTDNKFSDCETAEAVLWKFASRYSKDSYAGIRESSADALARIAELTPRTVDEAGRERARRVMAAITGERGWEWTTDAVNRIIDALGWQAEPDCGDCGQCCRPEPPDPAPEPPAPGVELDARQIQALNSVGNALAGTDLEILRVQILGVDAEFRQVFSRPDNPWALRIGGDQ